MSTQDLQHPGATLAQAGSLKKPLWFSVAFHAVLFGSLIVSTIESRRGEEWGSAGGGQGAVTVKLTGSAGVPMPRPEVLTPNRVVDESKGLYKDEPKPPEIPPPDATKLPEFTKNKPPKMPPSHPSKVLENKTVPPPNAIPNGAGGAPSVPYSQFNMPNSNSQGGINVSGGGPGAGSGEFAGRYPFYVEAVRNRVSSNWLQSTIDPQLQFAPRCEVTFEILRNGQIVNAQLTKSSGNMSVDSSALRAVQNSSPVTPLPNEYSGQSVTVQFYFDFKR